jgi:MFS family permease
MTNKQSRLYRGWIVVAACLLISVVTFGIRYSYGIFFKSLEADFGWSRGLTSGVYSGYALLCSVFAVLGGWSLDRYGPRRVMVLTGFFTGLSLLLSSYANSLWHLFFTYSLLLAAGTGATYTITMTIASGWFARRRGLALGIVGSGAGVGIIVMMPIASYLVTVYGWQGAYFMMGLAALVIAIPSALLLSRVSGALPAGEQLVPSHPVTLGAQPVNDPEDFSVFQAVRTGNFWLLFFIWFLYSFCLHLVLTHLAPHITDLGISAMTAASILSLLGGTSIPGRIFMGRVSDTIGRKQAAIISALLMAGAMVLFAWGSTLPLLYLAGAIFGLFYGGIDPPVVALIGDVFGLRHMGVILGVLIVGWSAGAAAGPTLGGYVFDVQGDYFVAFLAGAAAMTLAAAFIILVRRPPGVYEQLGR